MSPGSSLLPPWSHQVHLEPWQLGGQARQRGAAPRRQASLWVLRAGVPEGSLCHPVLQSCFAVVLGGPQEMGQLLEHKFDYIFFTGEADPPGPSEGWVLSPGAGPFTGHNVTEDSICPC